MRRKPRKKSLRCSESEIMGRTLFLIKPDGIERGLGGEIIKRIEDAGLKITAMKMIRVDKDFAEEHYPDTEAQIVGMGTKTLDAARKAGAFEEIKELFGSEDPREVGLILRERLVEYLISSPVIAMVIEGDDAVKKIREISGYTDPAKAKKGTIRGDFAEDSIMSSNREKRAVRNLIHAAGSEEEAEREIMLWFKPEEIY